MAHWGWPQWAMVAWFAFFVILAPSQARSDGDRMLVSIINATEAFILWCGGFWS